MKNPEFTILLDFYSFCDKKYNEYLCHLVDFTLDPLSNTGISPSPAYRTVLEINGFSVAIFCDISDNRCTVGDWGEALCNRVFVSASLRVDSASNSSNQLFGPFLVVGMAMASSTRLVTDSFPKTKKDRPINQKLKQSKAKDVIHQKGKNCSPVLGRHNGG